MNHIFIVRSQDFALIISKLSQHINIMHLSIILLYEYDEAESWRSSSGREYFRSDALSVSAVQISLHEAIKG